MTYAIFTTIGDHWERFNAQTFKNASDAEYQAQMYQHRHGRNFISRRIEDAGSRDGGSVSGVGVAVSESGV